MKSYVIVGNGVAAAGCIEGIRALDKEGSITVISAEEHDVYCRPLISYLLEGVTDEERMKYRPADFYEKNGCAVLYGKKAVKIDLESKAVETDSGEAVKFDRLCVAAGSSPFIPPMKGIESVESRFSFMTLDDAVMLDKAVNTQSRVLIVGAGLIGLKCAEGLTGKAKSITVCDLSPRILSSILDEECAELVRIHLESKGLNFILGDTVSEFVGSTAIMKSGASVEFDVLVTAIGVRPNISLIKDAGGVCGRAITVDKGMKSSLTDIYAAGDCTESEDASSESVKVMALMPNAYMQERCAGENMVGGEAELTKLIPMNSMGLLGLHIMTAGSRDENCCVYREETGEGVKKLFISEGRLTGFMLVGDVERAGILTELIRSRIPIDSVDFERLEKNPDLFAFGEKYRGNILGSVV